MTRIRETAWSCLCGSPVLSSEQKKSKGKSDLTTRWWREAANQAGTWVAPAARVQGGFSRRRVYE